MNSYQLYIYPIKYINADYNNQFYNLAFSYIRDKHGAGCFIEHLFLRIFP